MGISLVMKSMKRKARQVMRKYAHEPDSVSTAKLIFKEIDDYLQPVKKSGYIYSYHIKFSMELQNDNSVKRICKMDVAMTDISPWYYFDVEIESPTDINNEAYDRAMSIV